MCWLLKHEAEFSYEKRLQKAFRRVSRHISFRESVRSVEIDERKRSIGTTLRRALCAGLICLGDCRNYCLVLAAFCAVCSAGSSLTSLTTDTWIRKYNTLQRPAQEGGSLSVLMMHFHSAVYWFCMRVCWFLFSICN